MELPGAATPTASMKELEQLAHVQESETEGLLERSLQLGAGEGSGEVDECALDGGDGEVVVGRDLAGEE